MDVDGVSKKRNYSPTGVKRQVDKAHSRTRVNLTLALEH